MNLVPRGFTILDVMIALTISVIVSVIAVPAYTRFADDSNDSAALADIMRIGLAIERFDANNFQFPDSLDELPGIPRSDPWGNPYVYLRIEGNDSPGVRGQQRKDKNLNPLNTDFDLFSMGKDGESQTPLTARASHDDLIRAGNGGFLGRAEDH